MIKKAVILLILLFNITSFALDLSELSSPMPTEGRMSISDNPEPRQTQKIKTVEQQKTVLKSKKEENNAINAKPDLSFADLSLKKLAQDIAYEVENDGYEFNSDMSVLWAAALERSETMKYTIYKLSNPDEDKPDESAVRKILKPIANISSIAGASVAGDPFMATGALIGGGLVNAFMKNDKEYNYKFSKVSDADMVLLVRKIDNLQKKLLELYIDYKTKEELYNMANQNLKKREDIYKNSKNKSREELTIADNYYRNAKAQAQKANDDFQTSKAILENLVGKDAINKI